jgi:hypothetical protein
MWFGPWSYFFALTPVILPQDHQNGKERGGCARIAAWQIKVVSIIEIMSWVAAALSDKKIYTLVQICRSFRLAGVFFTWRSEFLSWWNCSGAGPIDIREDPGSTELFPRSNAAYNSTIICVSQHRWRAQSQARGSSWKELIYCHSERTCNWMGRVSGRSYLASRAGKQHWISLWWHPWSTFTEHAPPLSCTP